MCFGTFDILHPGHIFYLQKSKELGDYLIAVVARDANVIKLKGKLPVDNEKERLKKVKKTDLIDKVILGNLKDKYGVIKKYKPDIISLGYDQRVDLKDLQKVFTGKIIRQKPYKPKIYKSSKINKNII